MTLEQNLRESLNAHVAIVDVSGGYTRLELTGADVRLVLRKSTGYDVHPENFPPGKVVNTIFAKAQATLRCMAEDQYEILVRRSYSDYLWLWLQRAGKEYAMVARSAAM
jgi:sarcosine oxidase subunit gamma